ncbi:GSCOCG00006584001-RA-CDS [Cotesia congregata]|nr:GSCOCG00006584001-RA-CDS [Cotesia congregata]
MTNIMASVDLKNWPILSLLNREFISEIHTILVFGLLGNEVLIVTKDGKVYALGSNTSGCLGTGDTHSTLYPVKIEALTLKGVKTFAFGVGPHVLALTNKGEVYSWGHNGYCELGNGSSNQNPLPSKVASNFEDKPIVAIACGSHHSLALTEDGETQYLDFLSSGYLLVSYVYGWGQNTCGQVGSGISTNQNTPRKINSGLAGKKIIQIACGQTSSVAVTNNGEVYAWGNNSVGQLGVGTYINQLSPQKVTGLTGIVIAKVVCGYSHTMALSDEGDVYVWGGNGYGQLGLGTKSNACQPLTIGDMGRVSDIAAIHCNHISAALAEGGKVYMWGQCRGQTTHSDLTIQVQGKPIYVHKAVLKIRCQYFRSMFQEHWTENNQSVIVHDEFSYDVYRSFLKYLYTDQVDLPPENALELMYLANAYFETQLKGKCVQMIKRGITINNVAFLYKTAIEYSSKVSELEDFCFKFALNHMTAVIQTSHFSKLDEATLKTFITKAAHAGAFKT